MALREDIARLVAPGSIGVELGVAGGQFSRRLLETGRFSVLFSIDAWDDHHNTSEMALALSRLQPFGDASRVIRAKFDKACPQFEDGYFDFIYIDGYAHTGQDDGRTLRDWWPKLKTGGLFAGDDYCPSWPKTVQAVDRFAARVGLEVQLHRFTPDHAVWDQSPSWYLVKP